MKTSFVICYLLLNTLFSIAQKPIELLSFDFHVMYSDPDPYWNIDKWYVINASIKYDDGSIQQKQDSIYYTNPEFKKILQNTYSISKSDYYKVCTHIYYEGLRKIEQDSLLLYFPFKGVDESDVDTINTLVFSHDLALMNEPKFYNSSLDSNSIRITIIGDGSTEVYRLEKNSDQIKLIYKQLLHLGKASELVMDTSFTISRKNHEKYFNSIFENEFIKLGLPNRILPHDMLYEYKKDSAFVYLKTSSYNLKLDYKEKYRCIKLLKRIIKDNLKH